MGREVLLSEVEGRWRGSVVGLPCLSDGAAPRWQDAFHRAAIAALGTGAVSVPATFWARSPETPGHYLARRYLSTSSWSSGFGVSAEGACAFAERPSMPSVAPPPGGLRR